ncbi:alkylhydroperoxidase/carboxymuconolactone decarboxylase family protein YurZ [Actinoplanes campanulatus]|uniref:Alkylhydroperoxidase/carboxymuconolactone decarboxylase family protein YurZ n=1 Tax=Actinoplanes campanulatus TaxID=113559 RepID=A0A7W5AGJ1_9ACTN|nr:carboxymuconolactone decarboxylase family protein [Actinoplanes campanulatus]MBB3095878.1 alkylhydroperoxidase/carboxymuconolactone decarboxylase family protein YurZ [Actinoplanes campanulatus]GGN12186.1 carboxymuconolactone decarboxylase [Actinoplanes campanulatus]GID37028.1 carboxymuconolactone decarboxylase [Actinoplanes campanulatus]
MTQLAGADAIVALDPLFARLAVGAGHHLWGLTHLTVREKAFVCLTADLCHPHLDTPLAMHVEMALTHGVEPEAIRELYRHLAPYVGYPILVSAFQCLSELGLPPARDTGPLAPAPPDGALARTVADLERLDRGLAAFTEDQMAQRWARPHMSVRERAIACLVVDVFYQTLGESLRLHAELARGAGATDETLRDLLRGVAEFGLPRAWAAARALGLGSDVPR